MGGYGGGGAGATFGRPRGWGFGHTSRDRCSRVERVAPDPVSPKCRAARNQLTACCPSRVSSPSQDTGDNPQGEAEAEAGAVRRCAVWLQWSDARRVSGRARRCMLARLGGRRLRLCQSSLQRRSSARVFSHPRGCSPSTTSTRSTPPGGARLPSNRLRVRPSVCSTGLHVPVLARSGRRRSRPGQHSNTRS